MKSPANAFGTPQGPKRCSARTKKTGQPCKMPAIAGGTVCRHHGGSAPQVKGAAAVRVVERSLRKNMLDRIERFPAMDDPYDKILSLATEAWTLKDFAQARFEALSEIRYSGQAGEQLRAEVAFYERAIERCHKIAMDIARLDLAERLTRIKEGQAVQVMQLIERVMDRMDLTPAQRVVAGQVIVSELRALETAED